MSSFSAITDPLSSVSAINEILNAYDERRQAIGQSAFSTRVSVTDIADNGSAAYGAGFYWREIQDWLETYCLYFINHDSQDINIGTVAEPNWSPCNPFTLATWRVKAGLNINGFTRVTDYNPVTGAPIIAYGRIEAGDCRAIINFTELQKGFGMLKWSKWPSPGNPATLSTTADSSQTDVKGAASWGGIYDDTATPIEWAAHCSLVYGLYETDWNDDVALPIAGIFYLIRGGGYMRLVGCEDSVIELGHAFNGTRVTGVPQQTRPAPVPADVDMCIGVTADLAFGYDDSWSDPDGTGLVVYDHRAVYETFSNTSATTLIGSSVIGASVESNPVVDCGGTCPIGNIYEVPSEGEIIYTFKGAWTQFRAKMVLVNKWKFTND